jgi:hypothetical protein
MNTRYGRYGAAYNMVGLARRSRVDPVVDVRMFVFL